jgi:adenylate cyclase
MAIFGAPMPVAEPPLAAVRAALDMAEMIQLLNAERAAVAKAPLAIGIGIATGEVIAGYTGTQARATYTCIGDAVNLAARLEAHTKLAARGILIDDATRAAVAGRVALQAIGAVQFKGKAVTVDVYAVAAGRAA